MRIGLISDTHIDDSGPSLDQQILDTFRTSKVAMILHCGDLGTSTKVLDHLEAIAPVFAVRGYSDPWEEGARLAETVRVLEVEGVTIGMVHDLYWPGPPIYERRQFEFPPGDISETLIRKFGQIVDVVAHGHTHEENITWYQGVLFLNPGSPSRPSLRSQNGGTFALLDIYNGVITTEVVHLTV